MNKIMAFFSCLSILVGVYVIVITSILNEIIPKIGYMVSQVTKASSYDVDTYKMNFTIPNLIAAALIIFGIIVFITQLFQYKFPNKA